MRSLPTDRTECSIGEFFDLADVEVLSPDWRSSIAELTAAYWSDRPSCDHILAMSSTCQISLIRPSTMRATSIPLNATSVPVAGQPSSSPVWAGSKRPEVDSEVPVGQGAVQLHLLIGERVVKD